MTFDALRERLQASSGRAFWRSLDELAETPEFRQMLENEFPEGWQDAPDRRKFLALMAAPLAMAGLTSCAGLPERKIVPYVRQPEEVIPGAPVFYATAMPLGSRSLGLLVESHQGRPIKAEGNPDHPASLGATDTFAQAAVLELWDPDRSQVVLHRGEVSDWGSFLHQVETLRGGLQSKGGGGFRLLTEAVFSPTLGAQIQQLTARYPGMKWHQYEPVNRDAARRAARTVFGEDVNTLYRLDEAATVVSLDADFLGTMPGSVAYARQFAARRHPDSTSGAEMLRLYAAEPMPTVTGTMADHRLRMRASEVEGLGRALAAELGVRVSTGADAGVASGAKDWVQLAARDLESHRGSGVVIPGQFQPESVHVLAHLMNHALGNVGRTVFYTDPLEVEPVDQAESIQDLIDDMRDGTVDTLLILSGNPAYAAPRSHDLAEALRRVGLKIHCGLYDDETAQLCDWHVPRAHFLESWGDVRAFDGTCSVVQPLIAPLYGGKSDLEVIAALLGEALPAPLEMVRTYWKARTKTQEGEGGFDEFWRLSLQDGVIRGTALPHKSPQPKSVMLPPLEKVSGVEAVFRPDPNIWDGRFANNGWLQELPRPVTKITWDNAAVMSPATAERLKVSSEDLVELSVNHRRVMAPVWVLPGHADGSVTLHLGYGRKRAGKVGAGAGFDAYELMPGSGAWCANGLQLTRTGKRYPLAVKQREQIINRQDLIRTASLADYRANPRAAGDVHAPPPGLTLYPGYEYKGYAWGMTIDLNACTGCGVCTIACQAENNIPVVGKDQVRRGRAMHWIRVDTYFQGSLDDPAVYNQPVPCMQCENAPCELVCPVGATTHSDEGLNQMVYNRCVGTRYCSNNCPYKVRRFNFFQYTDWETESLKGARNPDVTVRSRGVMEKCTYCVQRIQEGKIEAEKENRRLRDGEVVTACQQACPAQAIVFGDMNDPKSRVSRQKKLPRNYGLLEDLNTRPRTTYLAQISNRNPASGRKS